MKPVNIASVLALFAGSFWTGSVTGQEIQSVADTSKVILRGGTQEVLLDFVVRDKHQRLVRDLRPQDVQIVEDGVPQKVRSFVFRDGRTPESAASASPSLGSGLYQSSSPLRQINLVTLVFEAMSPLSRRMAVERAHDFLKAETGPNTWIAVYSLRYRLAILQPYTTDLTLLSKALDHAATGAYRQFAEESLQIVQRMNSLKSTGAVSSTFQPFQPGSAEERGPQNDAMLAEGQVQSSHAAGPAVATTQQLILNTLLHQEGERSIDALKTLVREEALLPGRKTILFFSEGLIVPPNQPELLDSVIAAANRTNVSFYTVDTRGLMPTSNLRVSQSMSAAVNDAEVDSTIIGHARVYDPGPNVHGTDLQANARRLAEGTGGFAMDNSNDLREPLRRVMEDVRSHYEVTYSPLQENLDGRFRRLEVRLRNSGLKVQSRTGYYALPLVNGETIAPYEFAALNAINAMPSPAPFPYTAAILRFGASRTGVDCRIVFAVPTSRLRFQNAGAQSSQIHVSVLGLVKDEQGQIVAKASNDVLFSTEVERQAGFSQGKVIVTLPVHVPPGRFQLQTAVIDRESGQASTKRSVFIVPDLPVSRHSLTVSDIVWVRSIRAITPNPADVLYTSEGAITPDLDPVFERDASGAFYFIVYSAPDAQERPQATIVIQRDGKAFGSTNLTAPAPDETGAFRFSARLPVVQLESGDYELIVSVSQDGLRTLREVPFQVH